MSEKKPLKAVSLKYPDELPLPPAPAYDEHDNFKESYFEAQENDFILTDK